MASFHSRDWPKAFSAEKAAIEDSFFSRQPVLILEWHMGEVKGRWWSCFPRKHWCAHSCTGGDTRGVESDKRNASLHICFTSKIHKQNVFSQPPCGSFPSAFIKIDLPFEAMCSLKWQDFSLQRRGLRNWPPDKAESPLKLCYLTITAGTKLLMLSLNRHVIERLNHQQRHIDLKIYMCVHILELHNS